jgi:3,4-dehydroadipyl-CoA semialdehyde dehydrogenase
MCKQNVNHTDVLLTMTERLSNFLGGQWQAGSPLDDPVLGYELVRVDATGLDLAAGFEFTREQGGAALRARTYRQCAGLLEKAAPALLSGVPVIVKPATATA